MKETRRLARPPLKLPSKTELHTQSPPVLSDMQGLKASKGMRDPVYFLIGSQFMNKARRIFLVKQSACHAGVRSLGQEDSLEKGMATHSSILAWRSPWTEEPGGLQSMGLQSQTQLDRNSHVHDHPGCKGG